MASQQSVRRVTRGTVKRNTVDGEVLTSARAKAAPDERVHILPADTASLMGFGAGTDSDEECAAALEPHDSEGLGPFETQHSQSNESEMEDSADEHAYLDHGQGRVVQEAAFDCHLSLPGESETALAGTDTEDDTALSADEDHNTVVEVATRNAVQRAAAAGSHSASRALTHSGNAQGTSNVVASRQHNATPGLRQEGAHNPEQKAAAQRQRVATPSLPRMEAVQQQAGQQADADGSPQPPVSARAPDQESVLRQPPTIVGPESYDFARRPKGRLTQTRTVATPTPAQYVAAQDVAAGDRRQRTGKFLSSEELLPLEAPDENDPYRYAGEQRQRESGLRMPLFNGGDWAGFISQFEACSEYYGWSEKTKAIRLYTSIIDDARKSLGSVQAGAWTFARLKKHMEVRYGKNKVFADIQQQLFAIQRRPEQSLYAFHDEIVAAANTANIPDDRRDQLVYTAFVYGLRSNKHMHRWVSRRDSAGTIESALELAEAYEDEYGNDTPVLQSMPVTVNARDSTGNAFAVALPGASSKSPAVSLDAVDMPGDMTLAQQMTAGFQKMESQLTKQFETIDTRLGAVEKYQAEQVRRWEDRKSRTQNRRDHKRARRWNDNPDSGRNTNVSMRQTSDDKPRQSKDRSGRQSSKKGKPEVCERASAQDDGQSGEE